MAEKGEIGPSGGQGPQGDDGPKGSQGDSGPQDDAGPPGSDIGAIAATVLFSLLIPVLSREPDFGDTKPLLIANFSASKCYLLFLKHYVVINNHFNCCV